MTDAGQPDTDLTPEQRAIISADGCVFVRACPGAGKTRTIVERFLRRTQSLPPRRGVAVLSFTNAAADEISRRCSADGRPRAAEFPNFVGTFDAFIARFLVVPFGAPRYSGVPTVLDSWSRLNLDVRAGAAPRGLTLDELVVDETGACRLDPSRVHWQIRKTIDANFAAWERRSIAVRERMLSAGYMSCADARSIALRRVRESREGLALGTALAARFAEVVVDEAQDCADEEIAVVEWLRAHGVSVVIVCDPHQAIFEFRDAQPERLAAFGRTLQSLPLTSNFRSAPAVCRLGAALRGTGEVDVPAGRHRNEPHAVLLLEFQELTPEVGEAFAAHVARLGVPRDHVTVLAHARSAALRAAGSRFIDDRGATSGCSRLADAVLAIRSSAMDGRARLRSLETAERIILSWHAVDVTDAVPTRAAESAGVDGRWLRQSAVRLLGSLPAPPPDFAGVGAWLSTLRRFLETLAPPLGWSGKVNRRALPRAPTKPKNWHVSSESTSSPLAALTVHAAKGREFPAVLVVLPRDTRRRHTEQLIADWEDGKATEARRVAYVAATRAERVVALALPTELADRVRVLLVRSGVEFETVVVTPRPRAPRKRARR